ncbi:hypothetical protein ISS03_01955 [Patescibacteria group bacterium]|nr:hypothetical protein [Patescibacteria group bacterium]
MHFIYGKNGECVLRIKFKDGIDPIFDYVSEMHIQGMIESVVDLFELQNVSASNTLKEYDLKRLIEIKFSNIHEKCREVGNLFYLGQDIIAEKVTLTPEQIKTNTIYLGKTRPYEIGDTNWAWRIMKNVYMSNKYLVLKKDELYNSPYFICQIKWNKIRYHQSIIKLLRTNKSNLSPFGKSYARLIKNRLLEEQEKTKILVEKQKIENELYQLLIRDYIHPFFIRRARLGLIPVKKIFVTNIFLDLAQSTNLRITLGDERFRKDKNIFLNLIKKNINIVDGEWGWLNKVMGDGCYIVFGANNYFEQEQNFDHIKNALTFSRNLLSDIEGIKKENKHKLPEDIILSDFHVRIGIESGEVEIGEAYEREIEALDQQIELGTLRIFDTDGYSVHVAKRIEEVSKIIIKQDDTKNKKGGIFVGEEVIKHLKNNKNFNFKLINLSKKGIEVRDIKSIKKIWELV